MIIFIVTKNQYFTLFLKNTILEKPQTSLFTTDHPLIRFMKIINDQFMKSIINHLFIH